MRHWPLPALWLHNHHRVIAPCIAFDQLQPGAQVPIARARLGATACNAPSAGDDDKHDDATSDPDDPRSLAGLAGLPPTCICACMYRWRSLHRLRHPQIREDPSRVHAGAIRGRRLLVLQPGCPRARRTSSSWFSSRPNIPESRLDDLSMLALDGRPSCLQSAQLVPSQGPPCWLS